MRAVGHLAAKEIRTARLAFVFALVWVALGLLIAASLSRSDEDPLTVSMRPSLSQFFHLLLTPLVALGLSLLPALADQRRGRLDFLLTCPVRIDHAIWVKWAVSLAVALAVAVPLIAIVPPASIALLFLRPALPDDPAAAMTFMAEMNRPWILLVPLAFAHALFFFGALAVVPSFSAGGGSGFFNAAYIVAAVFLLHRLTEPPHAPAEVALMLGISGFLFLMLPRVLHTMAFQQPRSAQGEEWHLTGRVRVDSEARLSQRRTVLRHVWSEVGAPFLGGVIGPPVMLALIQARLSFPSAAGAARMDLSLLFVLTCGVMLGMCALLGAAAYIGERSSGATAFVRTLPIRRRGLVHLRLGIAAGLSVVAWLLLLGLIAAVVRWFPGARLGDLALGIGVGCLLGLALLGLCSVLAVALRAEVVIAVGLVMSLVLMVQLMGFAEGEAFALGPLMVSLIALGLASPWMTPWLDWRREV